MLLKQFFVCSLGKVPVDVSQCSRCMVAVAVSKLLESTVVVHTVLMKIYCDEVSDFVEVLLLTS